jgi:shikimate kinase
MTQSIFITGFRAVGKSTISPLLAQKLNWQTVEMDTIIQQQSGQNVAQMTQNGTNWQSFRLLETRVLSELIQTKNIVVSCGGGCGVNDVVIDPKVIKTDVELYPIFQNLVPKQLNCEGKNPTITYGQLQKHLLEQANNSLTILLDTDEQIISSRLAENYSNGADHRQSLDGSADSEIAQKVAKDMLIYVKRKPLYQELTPFVIESSQALELIVNQILELI